MADEVKIIASLQCEKDNFKFPKLGGSQLSFDQAGVGGGVPGKFTATVAGASVSLTELTTLGWARFQNLDDTNFVQWGIFDTAFRICGRMEAGEPAVLRLEPGTTYHFKADTADCDLQISVLED